MRRDMIVNVIVKMIWPVKVVVVASIDWIIKIQYSKIELLNCWRKRIKWRKCLQKWQRVWINGKIEGLKLKKWSSLKRKLGESSRNSYKKRKKLKIFYYRKRYNPQKGKKKNRNSRYKNYKKDHKKKIKKYQKYSLNCQLLD